MTKKAMFFSLIAILIILVVIISYKIATEKSLEETKLASTQIRIKMLNSFINDLENVYFENMLKVAAKTALQALSNYTAYGGELGIPINEDNKKPGAFETVMLFGYLRGTGLDCEDSLCKEYKSKLSDAQYTRYKNYEFSKIDDRLKNYNARPIMQYYAFFDLLNKTENTLENLGVNTDSFSISIDDLTQTDNWDLHFKAIIDYHFIDKYEIAAWRGRTEKEFDISIYGFTDPLSGDIIDKEKWKECKGAGCIDFPTFLNRLKIGTDENNIYGICKLDETCDKTIP